jgi:hypothetical protein
VLDPDARDSIAAMDLVLARPAISSQLTDNLNASMHRRALLTDVFVPARFLEPSEQRRNQDARVLCSIVRLSEHPKPGGARTNFRF